MSAKVDCPVPCTLLVKLASSTTASACVQHHNLHALLTAPLGHPSLISAVQVGEMDYIRSLVQGEHEVQVEDLGLCEGVQAGLGGPAYDVGRCGSSLPQAGRFKTCFCPGCWLPCLSARGSTWNVQPSTSKALILCTARPGL